MRNSLFATLATCLFSVGGLRATLYGLRAYANGESKRIAQTQTYTLSDKVAPYWNDLRALPGATEAKLTSARDCIEGTTTLDPHTSTLSATDTEALRQCLNTR